MFDVGFWELALIGVVALIVVGPEKMPGLIRTAGRWAGQIQRMARDLRREIEFEAQTEEYRALNREFREEDRRLKELARNPGAAVKAAVTQATEPAAPAGADTLAGASGNAVAGNEATPAPRDDAPAAG